MLSCVFSFSSKSILFFCKSSKRLSPVISNSAFVILSWYSKFLISAFNDSISFLYGPLDAEGEGGDIDFGGRDGGGAAELESDFDGRRPGGSNRTEYPRRIVFSSAVVDETKCNSDDEEKKDDSSVVVSTPRCEVRRYLPHSPSADETKENLEDEDDDDR